MKRNISKKYGIPGLICSLGSLAVNVAAQASLTAKEKELIDSSEDRLWYTIAFIALSALGVAIYLWVKSKKSSATVKSSYENRYRGTYGSYRADIDGVDAEKELEWFRKAKRSPAGTSSTTNGVKPGAAGTKKSTIKTSTGLGESNLDTKIFQEKMRKLQYVQLPINSFREISASQKYHELPVSEDPSLLNALEQANDEFEEDESVRDLAVRILTAFRNRNSVESLSQIALYDLSANLRSKAVSTLTDFDHESVFEAILLACADPTREVRAAAARGLFRLNFDRADAWKRIMETGDEFRMRHAVRAATEAGIVGKAFERLVHEDVKVSYEAFVLVALLIKSGETEEMFNAIREHKDERVKYALLHVLKVLKDERSLSGLNDLLGGNTFPTDVNERLLDTIKSFEHVPA